MKNIRHFLLSALFLAAGLGAMIAADGPAKPVPPVDVVSNLTKELADAKAQVTTLTAQAQQQQLVSEYYKAVAEKNDAVLRLVAMQQELTTAKAELAKVTQERDTLAAAGAKAAALADKIGTPETKK